jgi:hypothetical protein
VPSDLPGTFLLGCGAGLLPQPDPTGTILDLAATAASLREVEENFALINSHLDSLRESLDDLVVDNMVMGYASIDELIEGKIDLFSFGQLRLFLGLNALVLCGRDEQVRLDLDN